MAGVIAPRLRWDLPEPILDPPSVPGFSAPIAVLLARRGLTDAERVRRFLDPAPDAFAPFALLTDAERALDRIDVALAGGERIGVWGDYDADGMTAVAVWILALEALGAAPRRYIPSRLAEGYGLSPGGLRELAADGVRLLITSDCGVTDVQEVALARRLGIDVIITDHHLPGPQLPDAAAVVDPHRSDCAYPDRGLTGAGLAYRLAAELLSRRGRRVEGLAAIAAIGTVADVAPMTGESRSLVQLGLAELATTERAGLRALVRRACADPAHPAWRDIAYRIAPRINAAGRIADCELAISLLIESVPERAEVRLTELEEIHQQRRSLTTAAVEQARGLLGEVGSGPLAIRRDDWSPGIVGLVAGRLAEALERPVAAAALTGNEVRGSVRAPADFHVAKALAACAAVLTRRGGHAAAGGFSCAPEQWDAFVAAFAALGRPYPAGGAAVKSGALTVDLVLPAAHLGWPLLREIERLAPFGPGNPEPQLAITGLRVGEARRVGDDERHVALRMRRGAETFDAIAFATPPDRSLPEPGTALDIVAVLEHDRHQDLDRLRLRVLDYADEVTSPLLARRQAALATAS